MSELNKNTNKNKSGDEKASNLSALFFNGLTVIFILFVGSFGYGFIEIIFRGYTHWSMMLTGGSALLTLYYLNKQFINAPITIKAIIGALVITLYELTVGLIVNLWFDFNVWDYSHIDYNFFGLICPLFSFMWFLLCFVLATISALIHKINSSLRPGKSSSMGL